MLFQELPNPETLLLADEGRIFGFFRFDSSILHYSLQATKVLFDRFPEVSGGIGNGNNGDHGKKW